MTNPHRSRNISLVVTIAGMIGVIIANKMNGMAANTIPGVIGITGLTIAFFGLCYVIYAQVEAWRLDRMRAGKDILARWTVNAPTWQAFVELNDAINAQDGNRVCSLAKIKPSSEGVEVVIAQESLMVGGDFHSLPRAGFCQISGPFWLEGQPECLEFQLYTSGGETVSGGSWSLRVPIAPGAKESATQVCEYYRSRVPAREYKPQNFALRRKISLIIAPLGAAAFAWAMLMGKQFTGQMQTVVLVTAITGILICPAALLCALIFHLRIRAGWTG